MVSLCHQLGCYRILLIATKQELSKVSHFSFCNQQLVVNSKKDNLR